MRCAASWTGNDAVYRPASKERYTMIHPDFLAALARGEPDRRLKAHREGDATNGRSSRRTVHWPGDRSPGAR